MENREINIQINIKFTSRRLIFGLAVLLLLAAGTKAISETLTMTTYYPSPSGVYRKLVSTAQTLLARDGGNVGVFTANPQAKLDVNGSLRSQTLSVIGNITSGSLNTGPINSTSLNTGPINSTSISNGGNQTNTGSLVIGQDSGMGIYRVPWQYGAVNNWGSGPLYLGSSGGGGVVLYANGNWGVYVTPSGSVGVGTGSPRAKMDVSGGVRIGFDGAGCSGANEGTQRYNPWAKQMEFCNGSAWKSGAAGLNASLGPVETFYTGCGNPGGTCWCPNGYLAVGTSGWWATYTSTFFYCRRILN